MLDLQGPPTILDPDLCKMFYFWLSACENCKKDFNTELGFNNYELSRKYYKLFFVIFIISLIIQIIVHLKLLKTPVILYHGRN